MSYERALELWKEQPFEPPPLARVDRGWQQGLDPRLPSESAARRARWGLRLSMLGFALMAVIDLANLGDRPTWAAGSGHAAAVLLPLVLLLRAHRLVQVRDLGRQMLVRAVAWSSLLIGVLVSVWGLREFSFTGPVIALGSAAALSALGTRGLGLSSGSFRPLAFRGQLLLALVMAAADAQTLLFSGIVDNTRLSSPPGLELGHAVLLFGMRVALTPSLWCGLIMALAVWGLLRLRTWALLLNLVANVTIAALALGGMLSLSLPVAGALALTAGIQLMLAVPILAAAFGDDNPDRPPLGPWGGRVARVLLLALGLTSVIGLSIPETVGSGLWRVGWIATGARHDVRGSSPRRHHDAPLHQRGTFRMGVDR